jgi:sulfite reductase alpha subunit-like flavoprotein
MLPFVKIFFIVQVYVCGDAVGMAPQVLATIRDLLVIHQGK